MQILQKTKAQPKKRFQHTYDLCKAKTMCEDGDSVDTGEDGEKKVKSVLTTYIKTFYNTALLYTKNP